jgi:RNA binding exosome subunit
MIHYILYRTQSHATEDVSRVREALGHVLPEETPVDAIETEGYFGNPITILTARLEKKSAVAFMGFLKQRLPEADLKALMGELPERVDEDCFFHLRLSKQDAFLGDVRITYAEDAISLRGKLEAYPAKQATCIRQIREYFDEGPR